MPKQKQPPAPPPAPFETGDKVKLRPALLARYPLWKPKVPEGKVTAINWSAPIWVVWTQVGDRVHVIDSRDLEVMK